MSLRPRDILDWVAVLALGAGMALAIPVAVGVIDADTAALAAASSAILAGLLLVAGAGDAPVADRLAWRLLGAGVVVLAVPWVAPAVVDTDLGSVGLAAYPLLAAGLLRLPQSRETVDGGKRAGMDVLAGGLALALLGWVLVLEPALEGVTQPVEALTPVLDLVLLVFLLAVVLRPSPYFDDRRVVYGGLGLAVIAAGGMGGALLQGEVAWSARLVGSALVAMAAVWVRRPVARPRLTVRRTPIWKTLLAYLPVVLLVGTAVWRLTSAVGEGNAVLAWGTLAVAGVVASRQVLAAREDRARMSLERDHLLSAISLEVRAPLTAVAGFAGVLTDQWGSLSDSEKQEMVGIIARESGDLARITSDLDALARNELASIHLEKARLDGKRLVADALKAVYDLRQGPPPVKAYIEPYVELIGDRNRLQQMLVHLLSNAHSYGGGKTEILVSRQDGARLIEVHDDGPGVAPEDRALVWERFERGAHSLDWSVPGAGLGLAIVRSLAAAHGGEAGYRTSERLGGACFWVRLPYESDEEAPRERQREASSPDPQRAAQVARAFGRDQEAERGAEVTVS